METIKGVMPRTDQREVWDLYNERREVTGLSHFRGEQVPDGYFHLAVYVWIKNSKGEYLISQRAASREIFPLMYECVGGSVIKGESSIEGAIREVREEVGIDLTNEDGKLLFSQMSREDRTISDIWLFSYDSQADLTRATTDEVAQVGWMTREEIRKLFDENKFIKYLYRLFEKIALRI